MGGILFCGFYGCGNLGDDAILLSLLRFAARERPDVPLSYLSGGDSALSSLLVREGIQAEAIPRMRPAVFSAVLRADTVVLGGGSVLQNRTSRRSLYYYLSLLSLAGRLGKRTALLAGGLGPIAHGIDRRLTAAVLSHLSYASFRDARAAEDAERYFSVRSPFVGADPAVLLRPVAPEVPLPNHFFLVSLREEAVPVEKAAEAVLLHRRTYGQAPVLCDLFPKEDAPYTDRLAALLGRFLPKEAVLRLPPVRDPEVMLGAVRHAGHVLTARYHLALFAKGAGVPVTVLGDDPKLSAVRAEQRSPRALRDAAEDDLLRFFSRFP